MNNILVTNEVTKQFGQHTALNKVSLEIPKNCIYGLLGPNGAGKTTLIRIINQITYPDSGEVFFDGELLKPHHISMIGYLPEERGLYKSMKVGEQALYLAQLKGLSKSEAKARLKYWFDRLDIGDWWNKKVQELSKGMAQKIQFIVTNSKNQGASIIFSTHRMESVEELCDHIALIHQSEKILDGKLSDIKKAYKNNIFQVGLELDNGASLLQELEAKFQISEAVNDSEEKHLNFKIQLPTNNSNELLAYLSESTGYIHFRDIDLKAAKDSTDALGLYGLLYIPHDSDLEKVANESYFYSKEAASTHVLAGLEEIFQDRLHQRKLQILEVSTKDYAELGDKFEINTSTFDGDQNLKGINELKACNWCSIYAAIGAAVDNETDTQQFIFPIILPLMLAIYGVNLTVLLTASAALFVGLGFALQYLFQDIISGILIILDQSLHVGDIIEVDSKVGRVFEIRLRTTRALTRDDKVIVIPNHKFLTDSIYNYTQNHNTTRESIKIGVAYGSDVNLVTTLLMQVAEEHRSVLKNPKPFVLFDDFGDSALLFSLNYFITDSFSDPRTKSDMRYMIDAKFRESNISIPFPQRDVHIIAYDLKRNVEFDNGGLSLFHVLDVNFAYVYKHNKDWRFIGVLTPRLASTFTNPLENGDFGINITVGAFRDRPNIDKPTRLVLGLAYNSSVVYRIPLPFIYYEKRFHPKWAYVLGAPKTGLKFYPKEKHTIQTEFILDGYFVNLQNNVLVSDTGLASSISSSAALITIGYQYNITKVMALYGYAGHTLFNNGVLRDNDRNDIFTLNDQSSFYFRAGFRIGI
ncbi:putative ABC transporter ATP-binding protein YhaQ [Nymphon striatum]|nr:putative ABC transporter ATP-binding protein YhaQ [Nymphon striatum]